jgi:hypothetical protein
MFSAVSAFAVVSFSLRRQTIRESQSVVERHVGRLFLRPAARFSDVARRLRMVVALFAPRHFRLRELLGL